MEHFQLKHKEANSSARTGLLQTGHGTVETPVFMPVGTAGAVKGTIPQLLKDAGCSVILANTYHMMLRPTVEVVEKLGGLHKLMAWDGPILTDSGGYQVFSLNKLNKISDEGVEFASHIDGKKYFLNPEIATDIQNRLGADIIMCFDQCTPFPCETGELDKAIERTLRWAAQCKKAHNKQGQLLFGIVQGEIDLEKRSYCAKKLLEIGFDGYAIGGLSVGEGHENMVKTVKHTANILPENRPRYLMGAGTPADIIAAVKCGIDMFDCVMPTRNGRNALAFTENGPVRLRNSCYIEDDSPIEQGCDCYCCQNFSKGAIRHFIKVKEMIGPILVSLHNIRFYQRMMSQIQSKIENDTFSQWADEKIQKYEIFNS